MDLERGLTTPQHVSSLNPPNHRPPSDSTDEIVYKGVPWITDLTASRRVIYQTPFASCESHNVWSEDKKQIQKVRADWLDAVLLSLSHS